MTNLWQWDEGIHRGTDYADQGEVQGYDARMALTRDVRAESASILSYLELDERDVVLEVGTGTGSFARATAPTSRQVIAIDISAAMLAEAESRARQAGLHNLTFKQDGFLSYKHEGDLLAAVVSQLALHHLPDAWKSVALHRLSRIIGPGGKLYLGDVVYDDCLGDDPDGYFLHLIEELPTQMQASMARHIASEYSTMDWVMRDMLVRAGFVIDRIENHASLPTTFVTGSEQGFSRKRPGRTLPAVGAACIMTDRSGAWLRGRALP